MGQPPAYPGRYQVAPLMPSAQSFGLAISVARGNESRGSTGRRALALSRHPRSGSAALRVPAASHVKVRAAYIVQLERRACDVAARVRARLVTRPLPTGSPAATSYRRASSPASVGWRLLKIKPSLRTPKVQHRYTRSGPRGSAGRDWVLPKIKRQSGRTSPIGSTSAGALGLSGYLRRDILGAGLAGGHRDSDCELSGPAVHVKERSAGHTAALAWSSLIVRERLR
jgi:hypothetical protein